MRTPAHPAGPLTWSALPPRQKDAWLSAPFITSLFARPTTRSNSEWLAEIGDLGYNISPVMDRIYFHSIYYREPGGILFEIATDSPGFAIDEPVEQLGGALQLPPWLETLRPRIEAALPPIHSPATRQPHDDRGRIQLHSPLRSCSGVRPQNNPAASAWNRRR